MLQALRGTGFDESGSPHLFMLIDPDNNFEVYRNTWKNENGLPFLSPHIEQLKAYQQLAVFEMVPLEATRTLRS